MDRLEPRSDDETHDLLAGAARTAAGDARRFSPPTPAELSSSFPDLDIAELLGSGGMAAVYRVRQRRLGREAALKVLPLELGRQPGFADRFLRESQALARLNHPHVVTVYDFGRAGEWCWLLMELVEGASLREVLRTGRMAPAEALALIPQMCDALQYAHEQGVVHRDIKPENILIDARGWVKIADFGLAKLVGVASDPVTHSGAILGSMHYMAPEQIERCREVDHRADIYSLGVVLYEMLAGELPLGRFQPPSQRTPIDVHLDEVVLKALERDPARRYQTVKELAGDVAAAGEAGSARVAPMLRAAPDAVEMPNGLRGVRILLIVGVAVPFAAGITVVTNLSGLLGVALFTLIAVGLSSLASYAVLKAWRRWPARFVPTDDRHVSRSWLAILLFATAGMMFVRFGPSLIADAVMAQSVLRTPAAREAALLAAAAGDGYMLQLAGAAMLVAAVSLVAMRCYALAIVGGLGAVLAGVVLWSHPVVLELSPHTVVFLSGPFRMFIFIIPAGLFAVVASQRTRTVFAAAARARQTTDRRQGWAAAIREPNRMVGFGIALTVGAAMAVFIGLERSADRGADVLRPLFSWLAGISATTSATIPPIARYAFFSAGIIGAAAWWCLDRGRRR